VSDKELNDLNESLRGNPELFARIVEIVRLSEPAGWKAMWTLMRWKRR
jgi:hypothetical protein